jgi:DNA-binding transcriptional LysR family regulator
MAEKGRDACNIVRSRDGTIATVAAHHQAEVERMPCRHHRLEALLHSREVIAAVADCAAKRFAPGRSDSLARQGVRPRQSIGLAAERLGVSLPAHKLDRRCLAMLSRRVAELEQSLGVRLIERGSQSLRLTDEGRVLHERTAGPLSEIAEAGEAVVLGASTPRGLLRVSAPMVIAHLAFGRIAARFLLAYPDVRLEIVAEDRKVDLVEDGYDLVIRVDPSPDERLVGRCFLNDERLIVAHHDLQLPASWPDETAGPTVRSVLLSTALPDITWRLRTDRGSCVLLRPDLVLRLSSLLMVRDAALAGTGAARCR